MIKEYFKDIQLGTFFLGLICLFPLLRINYNSYTIIAFALVCVLHSFSTKENKHKIKKRFQEKRRIFFLTTAIVYVFAFTMFYSKNFEYGLRSLQHLLALLIFPILIFLFMEKFSKKELNLILAIFLTVCLIQLIYIHYNFYVLGLYRDMKEATFYNLPFREAIINLKYESLHPSYISLWYSFSIAILLKWIPLKVKSLKTILIMFFVFLSIIALTGTIIMLSSRIGVLSLILVLGIYIIKLKTKRTKWSLFLFFSIIVVFSFKNISYLSSRFISEFKETKFEPPIGKAHNSINIRIGIYQCSMDIIKENFIFGVGIGDVQNKLNNCYDHFDTDVYLGTDYNSHNYFFNVLLVSGVIGLIVFLVMFFIFFRIALKYNDYLYLCFLISIVIGMFFENILSRNHGVLFFSIINTLFIQTLYNNNANRINSTLQQ